MNDFNQQQLKIIGEHIGIEGNELAFFYDFTSKMEDVHFRDDIRSILKLVFLGMDPSKLKYHPTAREEGNVITAYCFRNTLLEDIHADSSNRKLDHQTMKELMIQSSANVTNWLKMRDGLKNQAPNIYYLLVNFYQEMYTKNWDKS